MTIWFFLFLLPSLSYARSASSLNETLGKIPVQSGGRMKPFESFAREKTLLILGRTSFEGIPATALLWRWISDPETSMAKPVIPVGHPELRKRFSSDLVNNRIAPNLVLADMDFLGEIRRLQEKQEKKAPLSTAEQKALELYGRARHFQEVVTGNSPGFIPHPEDPRIGWLPLDAVRSVEGKMILEGLYPASAVGNVDLALGDLLARLKAESTGQAEPAAEEQRASFRFAMVDSERAAEFFRAALQNLLESRDIFIDEGAIRNELFYLKLKPFHLAWILYLISVLLFLSPKRSKGVRAAALAVYLGGFLLHGFGFILRCLISGRPPVTNMYESVIWVSWAVVLFALILWFVYRSHLIPLIAACVATFALLIGENLPAVLDPSIQPLVPVLRSNFWLTVHVLTITLSYGAFALNWGIAHAYLYQVSAAGGKKSEKAHPLLEFLYRSLQIGLILLASGTVLGGVWAAYSWGRFWGWDPKETWALIALLAYLAVVHGRVAGWLDEFRVAFFSALCFLSVLMAWYGVNFVLARGLHSYGFGGGGFPYVSIFVAGDILLLLYFFKRYQTAHSHG